MRGIAVGQRVWQGSKTGFKRDFVGGGVAKSEQFVAAGLELKGGVVRLCRAQPAREQSCFLFPSRTFIPGKLNQAVFVIYLHGIDAVLQNQIKGAGIGIKMNHGHSIDCSEFAQCYQISHFAARFFLRNGLALFILVIFASLQK